MMFNQLPANAGRAFQQGTDIPPSEPCTVQRAEEFLKYLDDLTTEVARLESVIFDSALSHSGAAQSFAAVSLPQSLDGKLATACMIAASLCGNLRTINARLAG